MHTNEFKEMVSQHKNRLFRQANWMLHNVEDAEDLVQEVFIKLWNMRDKVDEYKSVEGLLVTMTKNLCLNKIKAKKIAGNDEQLPRLISHHAGTDIRLEQREQLNLVEQAIDELPEQQQLVLQMRAVEAMETREIADQLGETENNIRVLLSRARKKLKTRFQTSYIHG
ncbi:MAG: sigma-70 family RNA polymerase sigma factor [Cyclobacteriaceae bacterium]